MLDQYNRNINYLRISVTDRCNFRCIYCMPEKGIEARRHQDMLQFDEIVRICTCAASLGISRIKITGGEPFVRKGILDLIAMIHEIPGIDEITMTTNGFYLKENIAQLQAAGVTGINLSLDTLNREHFTEITRQNVLPIIIDALQAALLAGLSGIKVNCVLLHQSTEELLQLVLLAKDNPIQVRFIELMPIGAGSLYSGKSQDEMKVIIEQTYGVMQPYTTQLGNGPAHYYSLSGFTGHIGFISAISHGFCESCNRIRLTSDGFLKSCLNYEATVNLREVIRSGILDMELTEIMQQVIFYKPRHHGFLEADHQNKETRTMVGIGG
ncbi:MAG: GTP 3',8-cyclase MoaA [Lachnospiraceae bacterium]